MSRGATISVMALYQYNTKLFDEMTFPAGFSASTKETVIENILIESADLECAFPNWVILKHMIGIWSKLNMPTWERIYKASLLEYNPIENYNRTEEETVNTDRNEQLNDSDRVQSSGSDNRSNSQSHFGTDTTTNRITSYDSNTLKDHEEDSLHHGENITDNSQINYGKADTRTRIATTRNGEEITRHNNTKGNIGVTTSQQMLEQEYNIAFKINVLPLIVKSFIERFCLLVY